MATANSSHVKQSHDPERKLFSHVIQHKSKRTNEVLAKHRPVAPQTKAQQAEDLRRAVENTR